MISINSISDKKQKHFQFQYKINLFNINLQDISCYSLGSNNLFYQSSIPPYQITKLEFAKRFQSKHYCRITIIDDRLLSLSNIHIKSIVANDDSSHFLSFDGTLFSCNLNEIKPNLNQYLKGINVCDIAQSANSTICYDSYMNIYCWGNISHLTNTPNHYSSIPYLLSTNKFSFKSAISKVVCGDQYAMFLNLTGEVCYYGEIKESSEVPVQIVQSQLRYIEYSGFYNIFSGKNLVALYTQHRDRVVLFNESIGLIEIEIKNYFIVKSSFIKFIDNTLFIDVVNEVKEKFIIEINWNNVIIAEHSGNNLVNIDNGIMLTYKSDSNALMLWSPYYHKDLSFANENNQFTYLKLITEEPLNRVVKLLIKQKPIQVDERQRRPITHANTRIGNYLKSQKNTNEYYIEAMHKVSNMSKLTSSSSINVFCKQKDARDSFSNCNNVEHSIKQKLNRNKSQKDIRTPSINNKPSPQLYSRNNTVEKNKIKATIEEMYQKEIYGDHKSKRNIDPYISPYNSSCKSRQSRSQRKIAVDNNILKSTKFRALNETQKMTHHHDSNILDSNRGRVIHQFNCLFKDNDKQYKNIQKESCNNSQYDQFTLQLHNRLKGGGFYSTNIVNAQTKSLLDNNNNNVIRTQSCILKYLKSKMYSKSNKLI